MVEISKQPIFREQLNLLYFKSNSIFRYYTWMKSNVKFDSNDKRFILSAKIQSLILKTTDDMYRKW